MDSGAQNGVVGEGENPTLLPQTEVPVEDLDEEKRLASGTDLTMLAKYVQARVEYFRQFLPDGKEVRFETPADRDKLIAQWILANNVIAELNAVLTVALNVKEGIDARSKDDTLV